MTRWRFSVCVVFLLGACRHTPPASLSPVANSDSLRPKRFYARRPYGSEAQFNPLSLIVNGGFDQLRVGSSREIFRFPYGTAAGAMVKSLTHPDRVLSHYGYQRWLRNEVLPLSTRDNGGGQWYPNYHLHLFAGGMTYARMVEWFEQHGIDQHPRLAAGATVYAWHLLTEMVENGGRTGYNTDGFTDLALFDAGSIVLWNQEWIKRWFSGRVEFTDWPGQPSLSSPGETIENAYMLAMLRGPLPRTTQWKAMTTMGAAFLVGVSRRVGTEFWISASGGFDPVDNPVIDPATGRKTVHLEPNAGLFLDRDGSLLVSLITKGGSNNGPTLNVYPGVIHRGIGLWAQSVRGGGVRFGIASRLGVGVSTSR